MPESPPKPSATDLLPAGTRLMWYEIRQVLGRGGFAVTYRADDTNLRQPVAIKEYLPTGLALRDSMTVGAKPGCEENFTWGRERFLAEAQTLARFKHRNIVRVVSFFEANNTAYLVMDFEEGQSLAQYLQANPTPDEATLTAIVRPLIDGLEVLHRDGFIHRDIKPDNIYLRHDGTPVLLDFGAARQALGGQTQNLTALLSPGYAPLEQYFSEKDRQGPWSDIYALSAIMYRVISGQKPPEASLRSNYLINGMADPLKPARQIGIGRYSLGLLDAIDQGLRLREKERPRTLAEWRALFEPPGATGAKPASPGLTTRRAEAMTAAAMPAGAARHASLAPANSARLAAAATATREPTTRRPAVSEARSRSSLWWLAVAGLVVAGVGLKAMQSSTTVKSPPKPVAEAAPAPEPPTRASEPSREAPVPVATAPEPARQEAPAPEPAPVSVQAPAPEPERTPPHPAERKPEQLDAKMQACRTDAETYCPGLMPGDGRLAHCMRENLSRFSEECRSLVLGRLRGKPLPH